MSDLDLEDLVRSSRNEASKVGAQDFSCIALNLDQRLIRFANNSLTLAGNSSEVSLTVYMGLDGRRVVGSTSNLTRAAIRSFVENLGRSAKSIAPSKEYVSLPRGPFRYPKKRWAEGGGSDEKSLATAARDAIDGALESGASRVAGIISEEAVKIAISTSGGVTNSDNFARVLLNVRAFADSEASGHGVACAVELKDIGTEKTGRTAGQYARQAINPKSFEEGEYDVLFSDTVAAHFFEHAVTFASAWYVEAGLSFLVDQLGKKVASEDLKIQEGGILEGGLQSRTFDDEGFPAKTKSVFEKGRLKTYLHNVTTSKKFRTRPTGNAGFVTPRPWNIIVQPGDSSWEEMVKSIKKGFIVTNNWYTRFQNYRKGEFSTVPRDASFYVEGGEIKHPVAGLRVSGSVPGLLGGIRMLSKDSRWIKWWEVDTPTRSPSTLISGLHVTKAYA